MRQLSEDPQNLVLAVVRDPEQAKLSSILGKQNVAIIKGDLSCVDSFQVCVGYFLLRQNEHKKENEPRIDSFRLWPRTFRE